MDKITMRPFVSGLNSRVARTLRATITTAAALLTAAAVLPADSAFAQSYVGNAYTTRAGAQSFLDLSLGTLNTSTATVGANATLFDTGLLNAAEQNRTGISVGALLDLSLATDSILGGVGLGNLVDATVSTTTTDSRSGTLPAGTAVNSIARVTGLKLGSSTSLVGLLLTNSLVTADVVQTETSAFLSGATGGTTTLTNFRLNGLTAAQLGIRGVVGAGGSFIVTEQQTIKIYDSFLLTGVGQGQQIGELTIHEQIDDVLAPGSLTTNALRLSLFSDLGLLGGLGGSLTTLAGANVIVSSSTAGFTPAVSANAPEPGSLALLLPLAATAAAAVVVRRRRK